MHLRHKMEVDELDIGKGVEVRTMTNMMAHKIDVLKRVSQNVHSTYISLQGEEY